MFTQIIPEKYHHFIRVLSFLAEQKIATGKQIQDYCFPYSSRSLSWSTLKKLNNAKFIQTKVIRSPNVRPYFAYSLTPEGVKELKSHISIDLNEIQIKSNTPEHDLILTDLRILFCKIKECTYFIPENIIRAKYLEEELNSLSVFRSNRVDSAVLMMINSKSVWLSVEYERSQKTKLRYIKRIKSWYENENIPGVLLFAENKALVQQMSEIDVTILPHLPRKILYVIKDDTSSSSKEIKFHNCHGNPLTLNLNYNLNIKYPLLDQNFAKA